jgi:membrane associated rhomboid family serine protease
VIPLRDVVPSRTTPVVTLLIILLNVLVFAAVLWMPGRDGARIAMHHGLLPAAFEWRTLLTSMFLHQGWLHLALDSLYLWLFGGTVEDRVGHGRFTLFYLSCGAAAAFGQMAANPASMTPLLGASGAIAGVLGAYFALFPRSRVLMLAPVGTQMDLIEAPAVSFLLAWFVLQLAGGLGSLGAFGAGTTFAAQVTGFAAGVALVRVLGRRERLGVEWIE